MNKKLIVIILCFVIIGSSLLLFTNFNTTDNKILEQTFMVNAIYYENDGYVEIQFQDKSNETTHVTLEILGMPQTFHKEYKTSVFIEKIPFSNTPTYGWQSMPVTLLVNHEKFGVIGIKTEIRPFAADPVKIIFSKG